MNFIYTNITNSIEVLKEISKKLKCVYQYNIINTSYIYLWYSRYTSK